MTEHQKAHAPKKPDTPAVHIPPPVIVAVFLGVGLLADYFFKAGFSTARWWLDWLGYAMTVLGFAIALWCAYLYHKSRTSILPHTADSHMIETGPFAWSRNPIYLSMLLVFAGMCLWMNAPIALLFIIPTYLALRYYVIAREEAYLSRRFGEPYMSYQSCVRRWL